MSVIFALLLSTFAAWFILKPHFSKNNVKAAGTEASSEAQLLDQKDRFLQMLRDLELDFATAKLSETDYQQSKRELSIELASIINKIDASQGK